MISSVDEIQYMLISSHQFCIRCMREKKGNLKEGKLKIFNFFNVLYCCKCIVVIDTIIAITNINVVLTLLMLF